MDPEEEIQARHQGLLSASEVLLMLTPLNAHIVHDEAFCANFSDTGIGAPCRREEINTDTALFQPCSKIFVIFLSTASVS